jgi:endonuclease YncB( thermonuclease family)
MSCESIGSYRTSAVPAGSRVVPQRRYTGMRRATRAVAFFVSLLLPLALATVPSQAAVTHYWFGKVIKVQDGDTIYVDITGDHTNKAIPIRNAGIQATELHPTPECHAVAARTSFRKFLKPGKKVRLSAAHKNSTAGRDPQGRMRFWRYVDEWSQKTQSWVDVQAMLLRNGDVMWLVHPTEPARVAAYHRYMQEAMAKQIGLWNNDLCGTGPEQGANLRMWLNYEANGIDTQVKNGEWMRIQNNGSGDVSLAGWKLRNASKVFDHGGNYYTFPSGSVVPAGKTITFYFGSGTTDPAAGVFYLGVQDTQYLPNVTNPNSGYPGRTIYLLDPQYDFRFVADYPCLVNCPTSPGVEISHVQATGTESVDLRVKAGVSSAVDLSGVVVENDGWTKEIAPGTMLNPGETLHVWCDQGGTDTRLVQFWGARTGTMLEDSGDTVVLRTAQSQVLDTVTWGSG